jgi:hypothetical protein
MRDTNPSQDGIEAPAGDRATSADLASVKRLIGKASGRAAIAASGRSVQERAAAPPGLLPVKDREAFFEKCQRSFEVGQQLNRKRH